MPVTTQSIASSTDAVVDFRMERLRRSLRKLDTAAALAVAKQYAGDGLAEAQYLLAQMLVSSGRSEDLETAKQWYEAAARQGHVQACKELWRTIATVGGIDGLGRSLEFMIRAADLGDYQASGVLIAAYGQRPDAPVPNMLAYLQLHVDRGHGSAQ
jgi:TPR repeat protein